MKMTIENVTENQAVAVLSLLDPKHKGKLVEEKFKSTNKQSTAIAQIAAGLEDWCGYCKEECRRDNERCKIPEWARQLRTLS